MAGLNLWNSKEKTKYVDRAIKLKERWREEYNKPSGARSNAVLDNLESELRELAVAFSTAAGAKDA